MKTIKPNSSGVKVNQLTTLTRKEYEIVLKEFDYRVVQKLKRYTLQGHQRKRIQNRESKNSSLSGSAKKLNFMLMYLKSNMNQSTLGSYFEMSQSKVSQWFSFLVPVLEYSLDRLGYSPVFGFNYEHEDDSTEYLLGDVTDRDLPRKRCYEAQKEDFSGKHHKHTEKNFGICDPRGYIHFLSPSFTGSTHDKPIFDELDIQTRGVPFLLDLGFLGAEEDETIILPYKKPKGGQLNPVQKQLNKTISSLRVKIEHAFAGLKRLKMIKEKIRIPCYMKRQRIVKIAAAIHNLRVSMRNPLLNYS